MRNARLDEAQAGIKIAGRKSTTLDMLVISLYGRKQKGTNEPLNEGERGE